MITLTTRPEPIQIEPGQTAVVVVDMQNAFASPGGMFDLAGIDISGAAAVVDVNHRLLAACRSAGIGVIYLQMGFKPDLSDAGGPSSPVYHKELALIMMRNRPRTRWSPADRGHVGLADRPGTVARAGRHRHPQGAL